MLGYSFPTGSYFLEEEKVHQLDLLGHDNIEYNWIYQPDSFGQYVMMWYRMSAQLVLKKLLNIIETVT